jgi:hypothetical protein
MPARHRHRRSSERRKSITITLESCLRSAGIRVHDALETVNTMHRNMQAQGHCATNSRQRCPCGASDMPITQQAIRTIPARALGFTPLIWLTAICMSNAFDIRRYTRADFAGALDGFRLRRRYCARSFRTGPAHCKIAFRPSFHVHIFPVHQNFPRVGAKNCRLTKNQ